MKDYQNDKYENFFLHLKASREGLAKFADFTATPPWPRPMSTPSLPATGLP